MLRPEVADVHELLRRKNSLIVHFSGTPPMHCENWGEDHFYPKDLRHVIDGKAQRGICCSTVKPGDAFVPPNAASTGCVGVVIRMNSKDSLIFASCRDDGTRIDENGNRVAKDDRDLSIVDLEETIDKRDGHNEWAVKDYKVVGIFAGAPYHVWRLPRKGELEVPEGFDDIDSLGRDAYPETPDSITSTFPDQDIYTFAGGKLIRIMRMADIYP
jgi:hypothetical protein